MRNRVPAGLDVGASPTRASPTGTPLKICYKKILPQTDLDKKMFNRFPMKTIHVELIEIPILQIKGSNECAICLNQIIDNKYISICHHAFHFDCIHEYNKCNNHLIPLSDHCQRLCNEHIEKVKPFSCPICRTILENNYY